jgi:PEP-CTERM motif
MLARGLLIFTELPFNLQMVRNMIKTKNLLGAVVATAAMALGFTAPASAALTSIVCDKTDVTLTGYGSADYCYGLVDGNITSGTSGTDAYTGVNGIPDSAFNNKWTDAGWVVATSSFDPNTGTWLSSSATGFGEMVVVLKQATLWGAWYFGLSGSAGTYTTAWTGSGPFTGNALSHAFVLVRSPVKVPEPATLALFGLGLAGLAFARRSKRS